MLAIGLVASVSTFAAGETTVEGEILNTHVDNFETKESRQEEILKTRDQKFLKIKQRDDQPQLESGTKVQVKGKKRGDEIEVSEPSQVKTLAAPSEPPKDRTPVGDKKVAVVLFNFAGDQRQPFTGEQIRDIVFTNPEGTNAQLGQSSYGKLRLSGASRPDGDVLGWYTIPESNETCNENVYYTWINSAERIAKEQGAALDAYDFVIYVSPNMPGCASYGWYDGGRSYINGYTEKSSWYVYAHELGHNFRLPHANSLNCTGPDGRRVAIGSQCVSEEYGDLYDVMGSSNSSSGQTNGWYKNRLGWLSPAGARFAEGSGNYALNRIELPSDQAQSLLIPRTRDAAGTVQDYYALEYHLRGTLNLPVPRYGTTIRVVPAANLFDINTSRSTLVDTTPETPTFEDAPLAEGAAFVDPASGVSILAGRYGGPQAVYQIQTGGAPLILPPVPPKPKPASKPARVRQWVAAGQAYTSCKVGKSAGGCKTDPAKGVFALKNYRVAYKTANMEKGRYQLNINYKNVARAPKGYSYKVRIKVNGKVVRTVKMPVTSPGQQERQFKLKNLKLPADESKVELEWLNNKSVGSKYDANLAITKVELKK